MTTTLSSIACLLACLTACAGVFAFGHDDPAGQPTAPATPPLPTPALSPTIPPPKMAHYAPAHHAKVSLVSEKTAVLPGEPAQLGLVFAMESGWHIYWNGFTTSGIPPKVEWILPPGAKVSELQWPAPTRHISPGDIFDLIYEHRVLLPFTFTPPPDAKLGDRLTIRAKVDYLICNDACIGEKADVELTLPVGPGTRDINHILVNDFATTRARLPRPLPTGVGQLITVGWTKTTVILRAPMAIALTFYPAADCFELSDPIPDTKVKTDQMNLHIAPGADPAAPLAGVLEVRTDINQPPAFFEIRRSRPTPAPTPSTPADADSPKLTPSNPDSPDRTSVPRKP